MANITLAQALKEKKRLTGEIRRLWGLVHSENSCEDWKTRTINVEETMRTIDHYTAKLVELKTKIGEANTGNLRSIYMLEEAKNRMSNLNETNGDEYRRYEYRRNDEDVYVTRTAIVSNSELLKMKEKLQKECNALQDKLDTYNAMHHIEFDTPLA